MTTHSSVLAWRIPWTEEPGRLQSIGSQRVGHDCSNLAPHSSYMSPRKKTTDCFTVLEMKSLCQVVDHERAKGCERVIQRIETLGMWLMVSPL